MKATRERSMRLSGEVLITKSIERLPIESHVKLPEPVPNGISKRETRLIAKAICLACPGFARAIAAMPRSRGSNMSNASILPLQPIKIPYVKIKAF